MYAESFIELCFHSWPKNIQMRRLIISNAYLNLNLCDFQPKTLHIVQQKLQFNRNPLSTKEKSYLFETSQQHIQIRAQIAAL